MTNNGKW